ncbi:MAG: Gfo/Idh/MocA family protein, partial [Phycisphaeraceae bacterium]
METTEAKSSPRPARRATWQPFPDIDLRQLDRLTDDTGMFQHATHLLPDPTHGYCIDDNARALIAALYYAHLRGYDERTVALQRYLAFVAYGYNGENGRFRNFMSYDRRWLEEAGSEDSHGRTIWSLGTAVRFAPNEPIRELAGELFRKGLPACRELEWVQPWMFVLMGLDDYLRARPDDEEAAAFRRELGERYYQTLLENRTDDWPWWSDRLTWGIGHLPSALLITGHALGRDDMVQDALRSLKWCIEVQTAPEGHLSIVGNHGWFVRGREKAKFDQQPLEAFALVRACLAAARITGDDAWADQAWICFEWFRGHNDVGEPLYYEATGGCQDGPSASGPNANQGAESSLAYLLSVLELHLYREHQAGRMPIETVPRTLGYAIVGVSGFAEFCLEQYRDIGGLRPVAVWNRTTSKARKLAETEHIDAYDELEEMLADPRVHLVHVATTPDLHAEHSLAALRAGKHVLCEKPLATNLADAQEMIDTAAKRDRVLGVNFMMRYGPMAEPVRQLVASGLLGAPLRGSFTNRADDSGLSDDHWFWDESRSGGIFIEHGVHFFDLVNSWLGEGGILAASRLYRPGQAKIDQVACEARYGEQTTASFYHGFLQPSPLDQQDFRVVFERGQIGLTGWIAQEMTLEAVLDEAGLERLRDLLPEMAFETRERFTGAERAIRRRGREERIDRHVVGRWQITEDKQVIYGQALRAL